MTKPPIPAPDRHATCPSDGLALDYYADVFASVFVVLHRFIKSVSIAPDVLCPDTYPDRATIAANCDAVLWSDVQRLSGLASIAEIDIGLRTRIGSLQEHLSNSEFAQRLAALERTQKYCRRTKANFLTSITTGCSIFSGAGAPMALGR